MKVSVVAAAREVARRRNAARRFIPHDPTSRQAAFLALDCFEALYGGAAGGGKTDALLMAALQYVDEPKYAALLLRRTYADLSLPGAIMARAKEWLLPQGVVWSDKEKRFTFPSGATLTFGYLDNERDKYRYQGAELQYIGFDELTQFPEQWYRYLLSRLRRLEGSSVPIRVRAASNPGGVGHDWVRRRFVNVDDSAERAEGDSGERRVFIPASLSDNPYLDAVLYEQALNQLDPTTRRQLKEGIWVSDGSGLVYQHFDEARNVIPRDKLPRTLQYYILGLDFGIEDENGITVLAYQDHDPTVYVVKSYRFKGLVHEMSAEVAALEAQYHFTAIVGDTGGMGKAFVEDMRVRHNIPAEAAEKTNKVGYISLFNGALADGKIRIVREDCSHLLEEWRELPWNEARNKESDGFDNHASDSCLYGWRKALAYAAEPAPVKPKPGTLEAIKQQAAELERLAVESVDADLAEEAANRRFW